MNVEGVEHFVGPSTEHIFTDKFWNDIDLCWNALNNFKAARKSSQYTDGRCLWYAKPLLESGTAGTKCTSEAHTRVRACARHGARTHTRHGTAWHGTARHGMALHCTAPHVCR